MHYSLQCNSREEKWKKRRGKAEAAPKAKGCHLNFITEVETKTPLCPSKLPSERENLKKIQGYTAWTLHLSSITAMHKNKQSAMKFPQHCSTVLRIHLPRCLPLDFVFCWQPAERHIQNRIKVHHSHKKAILKSLPTPASCPMWWQTKKRHYMQATNFLYACREVAKVEKRNYRST